MNYRTLSEAEKMNSSFQDWAEVVREGGGAAEATPKPEASPSKVFKPRIAPQSEVKKYHCRSGKTAQLSQRGSGRQGTAVRPGHYSHLESRDGRPNGRPVLEKPKSEPDTKTPFSHFRTDPNRTC